MHFYSGPPMHFVSGVDRRSSSASTKFIHCFRLDLVGLLAGGYVREDSQPGHVRLKFVHTDDRIVIQKGSGAPALYVGSFSDAQQA
jgi:hypothetical protein